MLASHSSQHATEGFAMDQEVLNRRLSDIEAKMNAMFLALDEREDSLALPVSSQRAVTDNSVWRMCARESHAVTVRCEIFPKAAHSQTAWNMLMAANLARLDDRAMVISDLAILSFAPTSTALRYMDLLVEAGLLVREWDKADGRRRFISLTDRGAELMLRYAVEVLTRGRQRPPIKRRERRPVAV